MYMKCNRPVRALVRVWMTMICFCLLSQSDAWAAPKPKDAQSIYVFIRALFWGGKLWMEEGKKDGMEEGQPLEAKSWEEILKWPTTPEIAGTFMIFGAFLVFFGPLGLFCDLCTRIGLRRLLRDPKYRAALAIAQAPLISSANITDCTEPSAVDEQQSVKPIETALEGGVQYLTDNGIAREVAERQLELLISHRRKQAADSTERPIVGLNPFEGHIEHAGVYATLSVLCLCLIFAVGRIWPSRPYPRPVLRNITNGHLNTKQQAPQVMPVMPRPTPVESEPHSITQGPVSTPPQSNQQMSPAMPVVPSRSPTVTVGAHDTQSYPNNSTSGRPKAKSPEKDSFPVRDLVDLLRAAPGAIRDAATKSRDEIREGLGGSQKPSM